MKKINFIILFSTLILFLGIAATVIITLIVVNTYKEKSTGVNDFKFSYTSTKIQWNWYSNKMLSKRKPKYLSGDIGSLSDDLSSAVFVTNGSGSDAHKISNFKYIQGTKDLTKNKNPLTWEDTENDKIGIKDYLLSAFEYSVDDTVYKAKLEMNVTLIGDVKSFNLYSLFFSVFIKSTASVPHTSSNTDLVYFLNTNGLKTENVNTIRDFFSINHSNIQYKL